MISGGLGFGQGILQNNNKTDIKDSNKYSYYSIDPPKHIVF